MEAAAHAVARHEKIGFQFSGGRDSVAALHVMRPHWDRMAIYITDTGDTWRLGPAGGEPVGTATGTAADLLLALWKRADLDTIELAGDTGAVRRVLELALTP